MWINLPVSFIISLLSLSISTCHFPCAPSFALYFRPIHPFSIFLLIASLFHRSLPYIPCAINTTSDPLHFSSIVLLPLLLLVLASSSPPSPLFYSRSSAQSKAFVTNTHHPIPLTFSSFYRILQASCLPQSPRPPRSPHWHWPPLHLQPPPVPPLCPRLSPLHPGCPCFRGRERSNTKGLSKWKTTSLQHASSNSPPSAVIAPTSYGNTRTHRLTHSYTETTPTVQTPPPQASHHST